MRRSSPAGSARCAAALAVAAAALAAGCGGGSSSGGSGGGASQGAKEAGALDHGRVSRSALVAGVRETSRTPSAIIKTASVSLGVKGAIDGTVTRLQRIAEGAGGYVADSALERRRARSARVVLRVPAERFAPALDRIRALGRVRSAQVSGRDVGRQLVDLNARLTNALAQERALRRLMARAQTVAATLRVQGVLADVQLQIEQLQGELRYLAARTSLATITVFVGAPAPHPGPPSGRFADAFARGWDALLAMLAAAVVALGFALPLALAGGLVYAGVLAVRRRRAAPGAP
jgi:hypothetical protein